MHNLDGTRIWVMPTAKQAVPKPISLYATDKQIAQALYGWDAPADVLRSWPSAAAILERQGLPKPDPLFGNRRFWPAVEAFIHRWNGSLRCDGN